MNIDRIPLVPIASIGGTAISYIAALEPFLRSLASLVSILVSVAWLLSWCRSFRRQDAPPKLPEDWNEDELP